MFGEVRGGGVGQQRVGGGVEAVREGDGEGGRHIWVAGLQAEVTGGETEAGGRGLESWRIFRTETVITLEAGRIRFVPAEGNHCVMAVSYYGKTSCATRGVKTLV